MRNTTIENRPQTSDADMASDVLHAEDLRQRYLRNLKREIQSLTPSALDAYNDSALDSDRVVDSLSRALVTPPTLGSLTGYDFELAGAEAEEQEAERFDPW